MLDDLHRFLTKHLSTSYLQQGYLLGVSGGLDSMVLLHLFHRLAPAGLQVATVNYGLRSEAAAEVELVRNYCRERQVTFHEDRVPPGGLSGNLQASARQWRLRWFEEPRRREGLDWIVLGNHADDRLEGFLLRMLQGRHPLTWSGFLPRRGRLVRPFWYVTREQIRRYAREHDVPWLEDGSNESDRYLRNRVRHGVIPQLAAAEGRSLDRLRASLAEFGGLVATLRQFQERCRRECIRRRTPRALILDKRSFLAYNTWFQRSMFFNWLQELPGKIVSPRRRELDELLGELRKKQGHACFRGLVALRHNQESVLLRSLPWPGVSPQMLPVRGELELPEWGRVRVRPLVSLPENLRAPGVVYLNLPSGRPCILRPWRHGDRFQPLGMRGRKLVSDLLRERSVLYREAVQVLEVKGRIAWVVGLAVSEEFKVRKDSANIYAFTWDEY